MLLPEVMQQCLRTAVRRLVIDWALEILPEFVIVRIGPGWLEVNYDIPSRLYLYLHGCLHSLQDCQTSRLHTSMLNAFGCLNTRRRSQKYHNSNSLHFLRRLVFENGL